MLNFAGSPSTVIAANNSDGCDTDSAEARSIGQSVLGYGASFELINLFAVPDQ